MLRFRFAQFERELAAIQKLAHAFLTPRGRAALDQLEQGLRLCKTSPEVEADWVIVRSDPIVTEPTDGAHDRDQGWPRHLYAEVTAIWRIEARRKGSRVDEFRLAGKASTVITLRDLEAESKAIDEGEEQGQPLAMWKMEVADAKSPGCFFHVHVGSDERKDELPFPNRLCVPRFPSFMLTPQAALAYTLGELFQDRWSEELSRHSTPLTIWSASQSKFMHATLKWFAEELEKNARGSPLTSLKKAQPPAALFIPGGGYVS